MNRHLRNFVLFALAFTLTLLAGFASAANYRTTAGVKYGNAALYPESSSKQAASNLVASLMSDSVKFERQVNASVGNAAKAAELASGAFRETAMVPKSVLAQGAKGLLRGGAAGLAAGFLADYLIQKGFEWMASANTWMKPANSTYPYMYHTPTWWSCGSTYKPYSEAVGCVKSFIQSQGYTVTGSEYFVVESGFTYIKIPATPTTYGYIKDVWQSNGQLAPKVTAADSDLQTQAEAAVATDPLKVQQQLEAADVPTESTSDYMLQPMAPLVSPKTTTKTTTTTNPDGSTQTESTECQQLYTVSSAAVPYGSSVPVSQDQKCTVTVKKYKPDGTVDTTTADTVTPVTDSKGNPVSNPQEQKTDCDKKPNSVGCADLGTAPGDPTVGTQTINPSFSWSPFSLPATCPAPQTLSTSRGTFVMSWQPECDFATMLRPLVIAFAGLAALYVAFGMKNDG